MPHLTYCLMVWHFSQTSIWQAQIRKINLRAVFNNTSDTYDKLLQKHLMKLFFIKNSLQLLSFLLFYILVEFSWNWCAYKKIFPEGHSQS